MKKPPFDNEARACEKGHSTMQGDLFNNSPELPRFLGTTNPRHLRVISALLERPHLREELDRVAGCSNGPELVAELRRRGLEIPCEPVTRMDKDGKPCRPGVYSLTDDDRLKIAKWRAGK